MNDAAPNGAQSGMVGGGYRDAVPTVLGQQAREWGQGGTCPSQGGKDYGRFKGALRAGLDQGHATIEIGCQHPVGVQGTTVFITPVPSLCCQRTAPVRASSANNNPFLVP